MKKLKNFVIMAMAASTVLLASCKHEKNPFFGEWDTPYGVPPFDKIKNEHFMPAFEQGIKEHLQEINGIAENTEAPTFENTIAAIDASGKLLSKVSGVFFNISESDGDPQKDEISEKVMPMFAQHEAEIYTNAKLFARVKAIHDNMSNENYTEDQKSLIIHVYNQFVRNGANLTPENQAKLKEVNAELSVYYLKFGQNVLAENNKFRLTIDNAADLEGLPQSTIDAAALQAKEEGMEGKWVFSLSRQSWDPFMQYSAKRELREKMFKAYANKGNNNDTLDNKELVNKIVNLSYKQAELLGYSSYAAYALDERMAKNPETVFAFLNKLWIPTQKVAAKEAEELQKLMNKEISGDLQPWDWFYYAEKLRKEKYNFDEEAIRPYLQLENVRAGAFAVANKLYGITFEELKGIPTFNPEATAYLVKDADGSELAVLYTDYFPRASKRSGAWMNNIREEYYDKDGKRVMPIIINICNFTKPTADQPSLLSVDEAKTLFHEFGHALHGLLSKVKYKSISGTNVYRDFVELPSQIMENWAMHPQVLKMYAKHYKTGEIIPDSLITKYQNTTKFNQGFKTTEFLAASFLDMDWYSIKEPQQFDVSKFEADAMNNIKLIHSIIPRYRSTYFSHIFTGGYSAGYYSYIWAEVLDADAFAAFVETGDIFNKKMADSFRKNILEKGGTEDPMKLYMDFRGKAPNQEALLIKRGLK